MNESSKYTFLYMVSKILHSMTIGPSPFTHQFFYQDAIKGMKLIEF